jgi:hypothetical protein
VEKTVEDAEGTASVVRAMSEKFDLLIVGRRGGEGEGDPEGSTALTSGLSESSEFPELGVLGDMLASAEFASKVSILSSSSSRPRKPSPLEAPLMINHCSALSAGVNHVPPPPPLLQCLHVPSPVPAPISRSSPQQPPCYPRPVLRPP